MINGLFVTPYVTSKCNNNPTTVTGRRLSLLKRKNRNNVYYGTLQINSIIRIVTWQEFFFPTVYALIGYFEVT